MHLLKWKHQKGTGAISVYTTLFAKFIVIVVVFTTLLVITLCRTICAGYALSSFCRSTSKKFVYGTLSFPKCWCQFPKSLNYALPWLERLPSGAAGLSFSSWLTYGASPASALTVIIIDRKRTEIQQRSTRAGRVQRNNVQYTEHDQAGEWKPRNIEIDGRAWGLLHVRSQQRDRGRKKQIHPPSGPRYAIKSKTWHKKLAYLALADR